MTATPTKDNLYRLYMVESRPGREIAEILGISIARVYRLLRSYRIPRRPTGSGSIKITADTAARLEMPHVWTYARNA
jgi:transposase